MSSEGPELKAGALYTTTGGAYLAYVHDVADDGTHLAYSFLDSLEDVAENGGAAKVFMRSDYSVRLWTLVDANFDLDLHLDLVRKAL